MSAESKRNAPLMFATTFVALILVSLLGYSFSGMHAADVAASGMSPASAKKPAADGKAVSSQADPDEASNICSICGMEDCKMGCEAKAAATADGDKDEPCEECLCEDADSKSVSTSSDDASEPAPADASDAKPDDSGQGSGSGAAAPGYGN